MPIKVNSTNKSNLLINFRKNLLKQNNKKSITQNQKKVGSSKNNPI